MNIGTVLTALYAVLLATALGTPVQEVDQKIDIVDHGYMPARIEITAGQRVMWANMTQKEQSVVSATMICVEDPVPGQAERPLFDSGAIPVGRYFERTFDKPGTFEYFNRKDSSMRGTVIVKQPE